MSKRAIIFDLDGTLTDVRHRLHHIKKDPPDWPRFFDACVDDPPHGYVVELCQMIHWYSREFSVWGLDPHIFYCSGRPDSHRRETLTWLEDNLGVDVSNMGTLLMREAGDHRPDVVVKKEMLDGIRGQGYEVIFAVDDRPSVVKMWRQNGVPCFAVDDRDWRHSSTSYAGDVEGKTLLTMMVGPTHAGKTTFLRETGAAIFKQPPVRAWYLDPSHVIASDQIRRDLHDGEYVYDPAMNAQVFEIMHRVAQARLDAGLPTVLDATFLRRKSRLSAVDLAPKGTRVRYVVMNRPLETKLASRRPEIPEEVIRKHDQQFRSQEAEILRGDGDHRIDVVDLRSA